MTTITKIKYRIVKTILDILFICFVFLLGEKFGIEQTKWLDRNRGKTTDDFWKAYWNCEIKKEKEVEKETEPIKEERKIGFCG